MAILLLREAVKNAHAPSAVAKKIAVAAARERNRGRATAKKRYPFAGVCEASGVAMAKHAAALDELEPEKGYAGRLRWVCAKANNSGSASCGGC